MRHLLRFFRLLRTWAKRFGLSVLMLFGLSPSMQVLWLEWLRDDLHPTDPRLPTVLVEIAYAKEMCRA